MTTRVINIRGKKPCDVYIGRKVRFTNYEDSKWKDGKNLACGR